MGAYTSNFAAIDIGSHTIRLLIAEMSAEQELSPIIVERRITRLAKNFHIGHRLKDRGIAESIHVLKEYTRLLEQYHVRSLACGATGVIRRSGNRNDFLDIIQKETGIKCLIISEDSEAFLSTKGILSVLPPIPGRVLAFDLGGSSTEFTLSQTKGERPIWNTSVFIGAATVTERYLSAEDPPGAEDVERARRLISENLEHVFAALVDFENVDRHHRIMTVGTAGTVTTLAAMNLGMTTYEPYRINGVRLDRSWLVETIGLLARSAIHERRGITGLEQGREDIILGGALIVDEILRGLKRDSFIVADSGLLEGLLLELIERENEWPRTMATSLTWRKRKG